jgi:hypothetical protein
MQDRHVKFLLGLLGGALGVLYLKKLKQPVEEEQARLLARGVFCELQDQETSQKKKEAEATWI